jgi:hypothetical protein
VSPVRARIMRRTCWGQFPIALMKDPEKWLPGHQINRLSIPSCRAHGETQSFSRGRVWQYHRFQRKASGPLHRAMRNLRADFVQAFDFLEAGIAPPPGQF